MGDGGGGGEGRGREGASLALAGAARPGGGARRRSTKMGRFLAEGLQTVNFDQKRSLAYFYDVYAIYGVFLESFPHFCARINFNLSF